MMAQRAWIDRPVFAQRPCEGAVIKTAQVGR
jgi:hypothetical protein